MEADMKKEYDLSKLKSRRNPFARYLKKQITIRLAVPTIDYFKGLSKETGIAYQTLIDSYLTGCAQHHKRPVTRWKERADTRA
jgi:predicted DNA binding CopG/RHH family protein